MELLRPAPPPTLIRYVTSRYGTAGKAWLEHLPEDIGYIARRHQLTNVKTHPDSQRTYVATAYTRANTKVAIKIEPRPTRHAEALQLFAQCGQTHSNTTTGTVQAPEIIEHIPNINATIMEWVEQEPLTVGQHNELFQTVRAITPVLIAANYQPWNGNWTQRISTVCKNARRRLEDHPYLYEPKLLGLDVADLSDMSGGLLHNDLVPKNILHRKHPNGTISLTIIDPEPTCGPVESDLAHLCVRAGNGTYIENYIKSVSSFPQVDETAIRRLVTHHARSYVAYRAAFQRTIAPELLDLANMHTAEPT